MAEYQQTVEWLLPAGVDQVPLTEIPRVLGILEEVKARLWARLQEVEVPQPGPDTLLTAATLAERIEGYTPARLYELAREDKIPHVRIGRQVRFPERAVAAWIASCTSDPV